MSEYRKEQERNLMDAIEKARKAARDGTLHQVPMSPHEGFLSKFINADGSFKTQELVDSGRVPALIPKPVLRRLERAVADELARTASGVMVVGMPRVSLDMADAQAILAAAQGSPHDQP